MQWGSQPREAYLGQKQLFDALHGRASLPSLPPSLPPSHSANSCQSPILDLILGTPGDCCIIYKACWQVYIVGVEWAANCFLGKWIPCLSVIWWVRGSVLFLLQMSNGICCAQACHWSCGFNWENPSCIMLRFINKCSPWGFIICCCLIFSRKLELGTFSTLRRCFIFSSFLFIFSRNVQTVWCLSLEATLPSWNVWRKWPRCFVLFSVLVASIRHEFFSWAKICLQAFYWSCLKIICSCPSS